MARPARSARVGKLPALLAAALAIACTPVPPPGADETEPGAAAREGGLFAYDPGARPLRIGEVVPDFSLIDAAGQPLRLGALRGEVLALTVFTAVEARRLDGAATADRANRLPSAATEYVEPRGSEILARFAELQAALAPALARDVRSIAVLLDASQGAGELLRALQETLPFVVVRTAPEAAASTATAFGVALWESGNGEPRQTYNIMVVDRNGRLADQFPGLDAWDVRDVVAAISAAAGRY